MYKSTEEDNVLLDLRYIYRSTKLIKDALRNGFDVVQMPNGDIVITEIKKIDVCYSWDQKKQKMVRSSNP